MMSVVNLMTAAMPCPVYASKTRDLGERMVYSINTTTYNGARRNVRMKTYIFAATMERAIELQGILDRAIVPLGDCPLTSTCTSCERNGGGWLEDGDQYMQIAYYDLVLRR